MSVNTYLFSKNLNKKNYDYCLKSLRKEITNLLSEKIREKNPQFVYTTVNSLKTNAFQYLSEFYQNITIEFYNLCFEELSPEFELYSLMELYKILNGTDEF